MSTTTKVSSTGAGASAGRGVQLFAASLGIGLFAFLGVRVQETLADRKALAASVSQQAKEGQGGGRAAVIVVHAKPKPWRPAIEVTGTLAAVQEADIGFKAGGRLTVVKAKVGDRVKSGDRLAALDVAEAQAQAAGAAAAARAAEVGYEMARDAEKRTAALFEQKAVSDAENLAARNRAALALAQLEGARAQAQLAATGVSNGSLGAPFSGLVTRAPNGIGKIVGPGEPMFHLEDTSVLKLSATLTEADARLVELGAEVRIEGEGAPAKGKVTAVLGSLDPMTRRVPLLAEIPNDNATPLLAGAFVRATVLGTHDVQVLVLPAGVLRPGSQDEVVVLVEGRAQRTHIAYAQAPDGTLLVRSGVTAADAVVEAPSPEVRNGDVLRATP